MRKATLAEVNELYATGYGSKKVCKHVLDHNLAAEEYDRVDLLMNDLRADVEDYKQKYPDDVDNGMIKISEVLDYVMQRLKLTKLEIK